MKKNGFIATSILYSFFLVFISLFVALVSTYLHNRILLSKINESAIETLMEINNTKISDLEVGDYIKFDTNKAGSALNENAMWIVASISENGESKTVYFMSDIFAQKQEVSFKASYDVIPKVHSITPQIYRELVATDVYPNSFKREGFKVYMPTSSLLINFKNQNTDKSVINSIFDINNSFLVLIDNDIPGTDYQVNNFYEMRAYSFSLENSQNNLINSYCGGTFNGTDVTYNSNNPFGYMNIINDKATNNKYVNYCLYASSTAYNHLDTDLVTGITEEKPYGDLIENIHSSSYGYRLIAEITVNKTDEDTYIAGGKGIYMDPYLFTNGGKQS